MKKLIPAILAIAFILAPLGARGNEPPALPPPPFGPAVQLSPQQQQAMRQIFSQSGTRVEQLHRQARSAMLAALTPQHRQLLGQVAAGLATSPDADFESAARQLDAALSSGEARSIVNISSSLHQQMHQTLEAAHTQAMTLLTPEQRNQMPQGPHEFKNRTLPLQDPGRILLMIALPHPKFGFFLMRAP